MSNLSKPIVFYEHKPMPYDGDGYHFSERDIQLIERTKLFRLNYNTICATQYVGFMRVGQKNLQVIPKIFKDNEDADLQFLFYLLHYTQKLKLKLFSQYNLAKFRGDFFEILIGVFAENANKLLRHDLIRNYTVQEQTCQFLRGKLLVNEQIRHGMTNNLCFFCRYDEFTENNLINKTLKYVCTLMLQMSKNQVNCKLLEHNLMLLVDVQNQLIRLADIDNIHFTRLNHEYKPLIELCRLFLSDQTVRLESARFEMISFMFDMNRLFEEFIFQFLRSHKTALGLKIVTGQKRFGRLFDEFDMKYDVLVETSGGTELLIDTKYKVPDSEKNHQGLAQSDFYQMFAYAISQEKKYPRIVLLYPKGKMKETSFFHNTTDPNVRLHVRCVDLEQIWDKQNQRLNEQALIEDLRRLLLE